METNNQHIFIAHLQFVLREAAKKCGIWEEPPLLRDIAGRVLDAFTKQVHCDYKMLLRKERLN